MEELEREMTEEYFAKMSNERAHTTPQNGGGLGLRPGNWREIEEIETPKQTISLSWS
jgi:hypothetical protein